MSPRAILSLLEHMRGIRRIEELAEASGLSREEVDEVIEVLKGHGACSVSEGTIAFSDGAKVFATIEALRLGCSLEEVSKALDWRDFEGFTSTILKRNGFECFGNLYLKKPRAQIDVFARKRKLGIAIDCKRWSRDPGPSTMAKVVEMQERRAELLAKSGRDEVIGIDYVLPAVLTVYESGLRLVGGVPIIPIHRFQGFILEFEGHLDEIKLIRVRRH